MTRHETTTSKGKPADTPALGHEAGDLKLAWTLPWVIGLFAVILIVVFGMRYLYNYKTVSEGAKLKFLYENPFHLDPEAEGLQPLLQVDEVGDQKAFREEQDERLNSYGWANKQAGTVRIPIERAMSLLMKKGLPARGEAK